jgi:DNA polymerase-3 subunit delta'
MIRFDDVLGHRDALDLIGRMLATDRVPHALLFHGPQGVGKASVARALAAALLCASGVQEGCGRCPACKLVESGGHPDLLVVERLPKKTSSGPDDLRPFIIVDQIRQLSRVAAMAPRQGGRRIFIIDPADRMNAESQNALLKTLEEPPGPSVLILTAQRSHLMLPTVRSRCFSIPFGPLLPSELARLLEERGMPTDEAAARAALSEGRPGKALSLELQALRERREEILALLETLTSSVEGIAKLPALALSLAGKNEATLTENLDLLEALLRDVLRLGSRPGGDGLVHSDLSHRLELLAEHIPRGRAASVIRAAERLRHDLRLNLNRKLVAESLLAAIAGAPPPLV